jgi:hypothetical protein
MDEVGQFFSPGRFVDRIPFPFALYCHPLARPDQSPQLRLADNFAAGTLAI